jgi:two-component system sensor histidine kinase DegS
MPQRHRPPLHEAPPAIDAALRDPATLWDAVQRASGDYIVIVDRNYAVRLANRVDSGFKAESLLGQSVLDFTSTESTKPLKTAIDHVFREGTNCSLQTRVRNPEGQVREFSVQLGPVEYDGRVAAVILCSEDITALKESERTLERERGILRRLIAIQEKERQLVSYEIHDGLAQYIAGAIMHLEAHLHAHEGPEPRELVDGVRLLRAAAEESRRLIGGLRPPALDELGIVEAIESLVADARLEIPQVTFTHRLPDRRLPSSLETTIFRLVQESLNNVRRHAQAGAAEVAVELAPRGVHVRISDDGRGFDPATVTEDRFGLEGIRQRCRLVGVEPLIDSAPGRGTVIDVVLPVDGRAL